MKTKSFNVTLTCDQIDDILADELRSILSVLKIYEPKNEVDKEETKKDIAAVKRVLFYYGG